MRLSFLLLSAGLALLTACEATRTSREATNIPSASMARPEDEGFARQLMQGNTQFDVRNGSGNTLTVRAKRDGHLLVDPLRVPVDGRPNQAVATDLDNDGQPEILIFTDSKAANGGFYGYELAPSGFVPLAGPGAVMGRAGVGYAGPDEYAVSAQTLVRSFLLKPDTAGARTITYRLGPGNKWRVRQVMNDVR